LKETICKANIEAGFNRAIGVYDLNYKLIFCHVFGFNQSGAFGSGDKRGDEREDILATLSYAARPTHIKRLERLAARNFWSMRNFIGAPQTG
jgi:hypothetical protein